jgi:hypothetical protein
MTEDSYYMLTDDPGLLTDTCIMLTVYDRSMTDYLQTSLAISSRIISHTRFEPVYIGVTAAYATITSRLGVVMSRLLAAAFWLGVGRIAGIAIVRRTGDST